MGLDGCQEWRPRYKKYKDPIQVSFYHECINEPGKSGLSTGSRIERQLIRVTIAYFSH